MGIKEISVQLWSIMIGPAAKAIEDVCIKINQTHPINKNSFAVGLILIFSDELFRICK